MEGVTRSSSSSGYAHDIPLSPQWGREGQMLQLQVCVNRQLRGHYKALWVPDKAVCKCSPWMFFFSVFLGGIESDWFALTELLETEMGTQAGTRPASRPGLDTTAGCGCHNKHTWWASVWLPHSCTSHWALDSARAHFGIIRAAPLFCFVFVYLLCCATKRSHVDTLGCAGHNVRTAHMAKWRRV